MICNDLILRFTIVVNFDDCLMLVLGHVAKYLATLCFIKGKKQKGGHFITNENFLNENLM